MDLTLPGAGLASAIGFVSGVLSGMFGIGGGILTTPAVRLVLGAPALIAVGTPLPVIVPGALTGALSYARRGLADVRSGLVLGGCGVVPAVAGAWLTARVGGAVVLLGTAGLILWAAGDTLLQVRRPVAGSPSVDESVSHRPSLAVLACTGALAGAYSGFFGLGGGFVIVPLLTRFGRMPVKRAIGTSLVAVTLLAVPGTVTHAWLGHVDWPMALALAAGVVPGALVGANLTARARDAHVQSGFAFLLAVVAVVLGVSEVLGP